MESPTNALLAVIALFVIAFWAAAGLFFAVLGVMVWI
ncbi:hypothetical protein GGR23_001160 [Gellertiella hungarica]|uniref:Uncharacterized protein n=1 Tax=Gellertiella hungarica TaxID=1572859 RepID=A0A7W6NJQ5_9HYPH|nr:hypothetical protein [Gellertiella hungarica]